MTHPLGPKAHVHRHVTPLLRAPGVARFHGRRRVGEEEFFHPVPPETPPPTCEGLMRTAWITAIAAGRVKLVDHTAHAVDHGCGDDLSLATTIRGTRSGDVVTHTSAQETSACTVSLGVSFPANRCAGGPSISAVAFHRASRTSSPRPPASPTMRC